TGVLRQRCFANWIPAFAGMTGVLRQRCFADDESAVCTGLIVPFTLRACLGAAFGAGIVLPVSSQYLTRLASAIRVYLPTESSSTITNGFFAISAIITRQRPASLMNPVFCSLMSHCSEPTSRLELLKPR